MTQSSVDGVCEAARLCDLWCKPCCKVIYAAKVIWGLGDGETTSLTLPDAFSTATQLLISQAKCTINRLLVSMLYLITVLHSGNARRRNARFRKSHFSPGEILVLERKLSNGCCSKTQVGVALTARKMRKTSAKFNITEIDYINTPGKWKKWTLGQLCAPGWSRMSLQFS